MNPLFRTVVLGLGACLIAACPEPEPGPETDPATEPTDEPLPIDADGDGFTAEDDCDDENPDIYPGAPEDDCEDPIDYNCDGVTEYADEDADGFAACVDCDDKDRDINPEATEVCDGVDNDCNDLTDDDDPGVVDQGTWFPDTDKDGFGSKDGEVVSCEQPPSTVTDNTDCNDDEAASFPGNPEICDLIDNDCDELTDDEDDDVTDQMTWFPDTDKDGLGDPNTPTLACFLEVGFTDNDEDCDDDDPKVLGETTWYEDADGDTYGDRPTLACVAPAKHVDRDGDCNDSDKAINPDAAEICDRKDNDCDKLIDDKDSDVTGTKDWYLDDDEDGYGEEGGTSSTACFAPTGRVEDDSDCDDSNAAINPGMPFDFDDDEDNDCDSSIDEDVGSETYSHDDDIQPIFNSNCTGCHGSSGGLSLRASAWGNIVNKASSVSGYDYVEPGLPDDSYLFRKVEGTHTSIGGGGSKMGSLSSAELDKIETWIEEGAIK